MRLVSFVRDGSASWGAVTGDGIVDLRGVLGNRFPTVKALLAADGLTAAATNSHSGIVESSRSRAAGRRATSSGRRC